MKYHAKISTNGRMIIKPKMMILLFLSLTLRGRFGGGIIYNQ
jgi:hypothetical protein